MSLSWNPFQEFLLLTGSTDSTVRLWDTRNLKSEVHTFNGHRDEVLNGTCSVQRAPSLSCGGEVHVAVEERMSGGAQFCSRMLRWCCYCTECIVTYRVLTIPRTPRSCVVPIRRKRLCIVCVGPQSHCLGLLTNRPGAVRGRRNRRGPRNALHAWWPHVQDIRLWLERDRGLGVRVSCGGQHSSSVADG